LLLEFALVKSQRLNLYRGVKEQHLKIGDEHPCNLNCKLVSNYTMKCFWQNHIKKWTTKHRIKPTGHLQMTKSSLELDFKQLLDENFVKGDLLSILK